MTPRQSPAQLLQDNISDLPDNMEGAKAMLHHMLAEQGLRATIIFLEQIRMAEEQQIPLRLSPQEMQAVKKAVAQTMEPTEEILSEKRKRMSRRRMIGSGILATAALALSGDAVKTLYGDAAKSLRDLASGPQPLIDRKNIDIKVSDQYGNIKTYRFEVPTIKATSPATRESLESVVTTMVTGVAGAATGLGAAYLTSKSQNIPKEEVMSELAQDQAVMLVKSLAPVVQGFLDAYKTTLFCGAQKMRA